MGEHIWLVRNPEGRVIGAGTRHVSAVCDMEQSKRNNAAYMSLSGALERSYPDYADRYEHNGYTLTREPLSTGTAGVTEAMVDAFLSAYAKCELYNGWTFTHRMGVRAGIRAALAASTRTAGDTHATTPTRGSDE